MLTRLAALVFALTTSATAGNFARPVIQPAPADDTVMTQPNPIAVRAAPSREAVRNALAKRREHNAAAFHAYIVRGVYPHNTYRVGPLNVWRDAEGHLCAAATMISQDGHRQLAQRTGDETNNLRLLDVVEGPLLDWMLTSGFTIEEIDQIQEPGFEQPIQTDYRKEDAKLRRGYTATEVFLKKHAKADLDTATDRLLANPELAWQLVEVSG